MSNQEIDVVNEEPPPTPFAEFLEGTPPGNESSVTDLARKQQLPMGVSGRDSVTAHDLVVPEIQLHCGSDSCNGTMFFRSTKAKAPPQLSADKWLFFYITYRCSNCRTTKKTFSLAARWEKGTTSGKCCKFGELPEYGPPTASRLIKLIGPDRDMFLKGRRCENQGLGIGAFGYYRRVVENQKDRILSEIIKVAKKLGATAVAVQKLEAAKAETQFSKALANVKDTIPQALMINGHNPLRLLHSALSVGLHDRDDDYCLERASSIRVVLAELSERLSQAIKDDAEIKRALSHLNQKDG